MVWFRIENKEGKKLSYIILKDWMPKLLKVYGHVDVKIFRINLFGLFVPKNMNLYN